MSHYARLKVTQDAPIEVIRAAYRVLAAKYHPDRHVAAGDTAASSDEANAEMTALNTAYQVLVNPDSRRDYDALLAERKALRKSKAASRAAAQEAAEGEAAIINTRVDMEWIPPKTASEQQGAHLSRRAMFLGGSLTGILVFGLAIWVWQMVAQSQMEQALSDQYASRPTAVVPPEPAVMPFLVKMIPSDGAPARPPRPPAEAASMTQGAESASSDVAAVEPASAASKRMPSVTDLSKLSNEELAQLLPVLRGGSLTRTRRERHPLDGQPLNLRQDGQLLEVLP